MTLQRTILCSGFALGLLLPIHASYADGIVSAVVNSPVEEPEDLEDIPTATPTTGPLASPAPEFTPTVEPKSPSFTNDEIEATAAALIAASIRENGGEPEPEPHTGAGCSIPVSSAGWPGAESALFGAGLFGLMVIGRRGRGKSGDS